MNASEALLLRALYVIAACSLAFAGYFPINNPDTFGHLAQGRQIVALGHVPLYDGFSFFRDTPQLWRNYEWLSDLITYRVYALGGADALLFMKCLALALTACLLMRLAELLAGARAAMLTCLVIVCAIPAARFRLTERPHLLTLPLATLYFLGFSYLLRGFGRARRAVDAAWIVALALLHLAWVNLHGSHLLGLAITSVYCVIGFVDRGARWKLLLVLGLQLVASCISPYGPAILVDAIAHVANPVYRELVTEWEPWQPTDPEWLFVSPLLHSLVLVLCVPFLMRTSVLTRALFASACVLGLASFRSIRFVGDYLLLSAPVIGIGLAGQFSTRLSALSVPKLATVLGVPLALCAPLVPWAAARLPPYLPPGHGETTVRLPVAAGHWLERNAPAPRVFAAIEDSWYLMFAAPRARFLVDGRVPFYGPEHLKFVRRAFEQHDVLLSTLDRYRIDTVVVRHTYRAQRPLFQTMSTLPGWSLVSVEDRYATFVRSDGVLLDGSPPRALALLPSYEHDWLVNTDTAQEQAILSELQRLPDEEASRGYRGFVRAMLALKPLMRPGHDNGLAAPRDAAQVATLRSAQKELARASQGADGVPFVDAYHALVSTLLCDFEAADGALARARREGESRETLLGAQELLLRRGEAASVQSLLEQAMLQPQAAGDGWLAALHDELTHKPACP